MFRQVLTLGLLLNCHLQAQTTVTVESGSIFLSTPDRGKIQVTKSGLDYDPVISKDATTVYFCRKPASGDTGKSELWRARRTNTGIQEQLLLASWLKTDRGILGGCRQPKLSADNNTVYYLLDFSATSGMIARYNPLNGEEAALTQAISFYVVEGGQYKGHLVAMLRKSTITRLWYWYWLLTPDGKEVGPIGDEDDLKYFQTDFERE